MRGAVRLDTSKILDAICEARTGREVCGLEGEGFGGEEEGEEEEDDDQELVPAWAAALLGMGAGYVVKAVQAFVAAKALK